MTCLEGHGVRHLRGLRGLRGRRQHTARTPGAWSHGLEPGGDFVFDSRRLFFHIAYLGRAFVPCLLPLGSS